MYHNYTIQNQLAKLISDIATNEIIDEAYLLTISLYLHFSWIKKRLINYNEQIPTIILKGYSFFFAGNNMTEIESFFRLYTENKTYINEIFTMVMDDNAGLERPNWLNSWFEICDYQIEHNKIQFVNYDPLTEISFYLIPNLINDQLGLSKATIAFQTFVINKQFMNKIILC